MNTNRWYELPKQIFKILLSFVISWITMVMIFSALTPTDAELDTYGKIIFILTFVLAITANFIIDFNTIQKLKSNIEKSEKDIEYVESMDKSLISKAERVKDKFLDSEKEVFSEFAKSRKGSRAIKNSKDFKAVIESYPEFKSNEATQKLLNQLEKTEATLLEARTTYSEIVARYNTKINSFPIILLKKLCGFKNIEIKSVKQEENIISDEELGI